LFGKICLADFKSSQYYSRVFFNVDIEVGPYLCNHWQLSAAWRSI